MITAVLISDADSARPMSMYKLEFDSVEQFQQWIAHKPLALNFHKRFTSTEKPPANTWIIGPDRVREYDLPWPVVAVALQVADSMERLERREGSGRYPARVLQATTSKERRLTKPTKVY